MRRKGLYDTTSQVTAAEREMRRKAVAQAYGISATSALQVTVAIEALLSCYIEGKLSCQELGALLQGHLSPQAGSSQH